MKIVINLTSCGWLCSQNNSGTFPTQRPSMILHIHVTIREQAALAFRAAKTVVIAVALFMSAADGFALDLTKSNGYATVRVSGQSGQFQISDPLSPNGSLTYP